MNGSLICPFGSLVWPLHPLCWMNVVSFLEQINNTVSGTRDPNLDLIYLTSSLPYFFFLFSLSTYWVFFVASYFLSLSFIELILFGFFPPPAFRRYILSCFLCCCFSFPSLMPPGSIGPTGSLQGLYSLQDAFSHLGVCLPGVFFPSFFAWSTPVRSLAEACLAELSEMLKMFYICTIQFGSHEPRVCGFWVLEIWMVRMRNEN